MFLLLRLARLTQDARVKKTQYEKQVWELRTALDAAVAERAKRPAPAFGRQDSLQFENTAAMVMAQMRLGVICIDAQRVIRLANPYAEQFLDPLPAVGKQYRDVLHVQSRESADGYALFESAFAGTSRSLPDGFLLVSPRGQTHVRGSVFPVMSNNQVVMVTCVFEDNSEEAERKTEEQAFFSAAAHELRTPLTVIRMAVSMLRSGFETMGKEKIMDHLRRTDETAERLAAIVNDFLNISRIEQGRLEVKLEPFDIVSLADEVIGELRPLAQERKLFVNHEVADVAFRSVVGDRTKTKEVLTNLIGNGIKYTVRGGLTITHQATSSSLVTRIADTGPGIPIESQRMLFRRFMQVGAARTQATAKSTGLGLYISKKFAQLMKGDVTLEKSEPGKGSVFAFTLPLG